MIGDESKERPPEKRSGLSRRDLLIAGCGTLGVAATGVGGLFWKAGQSNQPILAGFGNPATRSGLTLPPTPCESGATPSFVEGPFYSPQSPNKADLRESGHQEADEMIITGRVVDIDCNPIPGAVLDFWQVDHQAVYDNAGHRYRGHVFTDADGLWQIRSIHPTSYTLQGFWTTAHIHVKAQGPNTKLLTSQLYFPRETENNAKDDGWRQDLQVIGDRGADDIYDFRFDFVLENR